jgi:hypothetical protein
MFDVASFDQSGQGHFQLLGGGQGRGRLEELGRGFGVPLGRKKKGFKGKCWS